MAEEQLLLMCCVFARDSVSAGTGMDPPVSMGMRTVEATRLRPVATRREGNGAAQLRPSGGVEVERNGEEGASGLGIGKGGPWTVDGWPSRRRR